MDADALAGPKTEPPQVARERIDRSVELGERHPPAEEHKSVTGRETLGRPPEECVDRDLGDVDLGRDARLVVSEPGSIHEWRGTGRGRGRRAGARDGARRMSRR
jgi:hypothetical protein